MPLPRILEPLKIRDFALLWSGMTVSLLGDRAFTIALAWETYSLSNKPTSLGLIIAASTIPVVLFVVFGGVLTDRIERRRLMIASDVIRAASIGTAGVLAIEHDLRLWQLAALVFVAGIGSALFMPAFGSIVPEIVPRELLPQANALDNFVRPMVGLVGPALGGIGVALVGAGWLFVADAVSFVGSTVAALLLAARPIAKVMARSLRREIAEGAAFVRRTPWLFYSLLASIPLNVATAARGVLLPFIVKNALHESSRGLGLVYSFIAVGALVGSFAFGQRGLPKRHVTVAYCGWALSVTTAAGFGLARNVPQLCILAAIGGAGSAVGQAIWGTMMHTLVPRELLGRVYSLDNLTAVGILPVANISVGFVAAAYGARPTLVACGLFSAVATLLFLFAPGLRDSETDGSMRPAEALV